MVLDRHSINKKVINFIHISLIESNTDIICLVAYGNIFEGFPNSINSLWSNISRNMFFLLCIYSL